MKRCSKCKEQKPLEDFAKCKSEKDGRFAWCRPCHAANRKRYKAKPRADMSAQAAEFRRIQDKKTYYKDHERTLQRKRESARKRREQQRSYQYLKAGSSRARRLMAEPPWADKKAIQVFYREAEMLTRITGEKHHVDHIVPLLHPRVCGLHIPANLRVVTETFNLKKGNKFRG